ncbi:FAD-dependent oxidoreductase [Actinophytocola xanthii]|uniref:FAD-binding monooxygenase n=1 Tax=Actinophytocola xanthii TaxID=1912961 RepID=A0A1Q8CDU6_9PSEU|nr:FAD-dependent monooxygenase [Actinophytocola xanthii]OLF12545.1 FAD-binding monooxygenase [Actinophytocola xanthii]
MRVIVVGAGLGGLTLAQGLRRVGVDVVVYERDGARGRPQGVSLHLDDRATAALRACLPPGHLAMVEATMGRPRERTLLLSEVDGRPAVVGERAYDGTAGARPGRQAHRPLLRAVLLTGLEDAVRFGTELTRFEHRPDGTVRAWFADGGTDTADVLVGADGIGSVVRGQYLPAVRVHDTGRRMLMGATPLRLAAGTGLPDLIGDSATSARLGDTTMALGVLRYTEPPAAARDRWLPALAPRAVAGLEDYVMWALPHAPGHPDPTVDPHPTVRHLLDQAWPAMTATLRIGVIPPPPPWSPGPVTLLGDAIHLAPGFGANLAMRDAHRLRDALVDVAGGRRGLTAAIGAYEDAMRREHLDTAATAGARP